MTLGTIAGCRFVIHPTFWIIVAVVSFWALNAGLGLSGLLVEVAFILTLFMCVVLHEIGHAVAARRYGIRTESITLYPIGGVAKLERMPDRPGQELVVALAGPLVNVNIAVLVGLFTLIFPSPFLSRLTVVNVALVLFNLLPAFPMDGGRVLRALLAMRLPYVKATAIAAGVGRAMVIPFAVAGVLWNPFLLVIGVFIWFGATAEAHAVRVRDDLAGARVMQASMTAFFSLRPQDRLSRVVELTLDSSQKDFPVVDRGTLIGALTQRDLLHAIERQGPDRTVAEVMRPSPPSVEFDDRLDRAVETMRETGSPFLPVMDKDQPVGILTMDNVNEFMRLRRAFGGRVPIRIQHLQLDPEPALLN